MEKLLAEFEVHIRGLVNFISYWYYLSAHHHFLQQVL